MLLVSGGPDSVFLFWQFLDFKKKHGSDFAVLHFNHHLRATESDQEAQFVHSLAAMAGIEVKIIDLWPPPNANLQNWARRNRYEHALEQCQKHNFQILATAHHADDHYETLVIKKNRGAGLTGLAGIRRRQNRGAVLLLRPLLELTKAEIKHSLQERQLHYCEDPSNVSPKYYRNRVRQFLMQNPCPANQAALVKTHSGWLTEVDRYFAERLQWQKCPSFFLPQDVWQMLAPERQFRLLKKLAKQNGWIREWQSKHFQQIQKMPSTLTKGDLSIFHDKNGFWFVTAKRGEDLKKPRILTGPGHYKINLFKFNLTLEKNYGKYLKNNVIFISKNLGFPLHFALPEATDSFQAFGQKSGKPVNDFFQSRQIGPHTRRFWPVLKNDKNEIVAIPGLEVAEPYRVQPNDEFCYELDLRFHG